MTSVKGRDATGRVPEDSKENVEEGGAGLLKVAGGGATGEAQMDYKTFLDLVLAMENKQTRQVRIRFFFCWKCMQVRSTYVSLPVPCYVSV